MKKIFASTIFHLSFFIFNCFAQQPGCQIIPLGTTAELNSIHFIDPFDLYICGEVLLNAVSTDSGSTWQVNQINPSVTLNDIFVIDQNNIVTVGNGGTIMRTIDGGANWYSVSSGVTDDLLSVSFVDSFGICGALSQTILYSANSGVSWNISQSGFFGGGFWGASMLSPQIGFVAGENSIFSPLLGITTNSGHNWNFTSFLLAGNEGRVTAVDFTDMFAGYVSARVWDGRGAIAKTTNSGADWVTTFFTDPLWSIDFPISSASLIGYACGDEGGILKTYNAGQSWQAQQSGTTLKLNKIYFIDLDNGFAVGENGIVLRTTSGGEPTTQINIMNSLSYDFNLGQNYPNPFNPSTKIKFTIPSVETTRRVVFTTLKVYDILGNEIATLVNEELSAGEYEVEFSGHSDGSQSLSSGVYFYQLVIKGSEINSEQILIQTKKMVYLK